MKVIGRSVGGKARARSRVGSAKVPRQRYMWSVCVMSHPNDGVATIEDQKEVAGDGHHREADGDGH